MLALLKWVWWLAACRAGRAWSWTRGMHVHHGMTLEVRHMRAMSHRRLAGGGRTAVTVQAAPNPSRTARHLRPPFLLDSLPLLNNHLPTPFHMQTLEAAFKNETIGLVTREQFVKKRDTIGDRLQEEKKRAREAEEEAAAQVCHWRGCPVELVSACHCLGLLDGPVRGKVTCRDGTPLPSGSALQACHRRASPPQERKVAKAAKAKRERKQKLSFGEEEEEVEVEGQDDDLAGTATGLAANDGEPFGTQASRRHRSGSFMPRAGRPLSFFPCSRECSHLLRLVFSASLHLRGIPPPPLRARGPAVKSCRDGCLPAGR